MLHIRRTKKMLRRSGARPGGDIVAQSHIQMQIGPVPPKPVGIAYCIASLNVGSAKDRYWAHSVRSRTDHEGRQWVETGTTDWV